MTKVSLREENTNLREELAQVKNSELLLLESITTLEQQIQEQGWTQLWGGDSRNLSRAALKTLNELARVHWMKNPLIRRAVLTQALYVFGQGMTVKGQHPRVDQVVQKVMKDRKNQVSISSQPAMMTHELELALFGNLFYVFFTDSTTGRLIVRTIPESEISEIITNPDDIQEPWYYKREYDTNLLDTQTGSVTPKRVAEYHPDWTYTPTTKPDNIGGAPIIWDAPVFHVKVNALTDMLFGVSEIYSAIDWAKAYKTFLENWSKLVEAYAKIAWNVTTAGGTTKIAAAKAKIEALVAADTTQKLRTEKQAPVATSLVHGNAVKFEPIKTAGATTSAEDGRQLRLMICSASGIFEHYLTGDPSTGNLATAKAMERPMELQFRNRQRLWISVYQQISDYAVDQAIKAPAGLLNDIGEELEDEYYGEIQYVLADENGEIIPRTVQVTFPNLMEHDTQPAIEAIVTGATLNGQQLAGTMDLKTVADQVLTELKVEGREEILKQLFPTDDLVMQTRTQQPPPIPGAVSPAIESDIRAAIARVDALLAESNKSEGKD